MADDKQDDRRQFERLERQDEIQIKEYSFPERGKFKKARIVDISGGGLQIETRQRFDEKTQLKIEMNFTGWQRYLAGYMKYFGDAAQQSLVVLADVIRCTPLVPGRKYEVTVVFSGIDENHRRALTKFISAQIKSRD